MPKVGFRVPSIKKHIAARKLVKHAGGTSMLFCLVLALLVACAAPEVMPTVAPTAIIDPTETEIPPSPSPENTATLEPTATTEVACPPADATRQLGAVLEIVDGQTSKVIIDGATYTVKYLGVISPFGDGHYSDKARQKSAEYTYSKIVTLVSGPIDHDANGTLLRYVLIDDTFINLELIQQGYVAWDRDAPLDESCKSVYMASAQAALDNLAGQWGEQPTQKVYVEPTAVIKPTAYIQPTSVVVVPIVPPVVSPSCCKHCGSNSQPCGDSCISLRYTCHKSGGCACY
jgi:endonuclease YncB( thermonuclease family)